MNMKYEYEYDSYGITDLWIFYWLLMIIIELWMTKGCWFKFYWKYLGVISRRMNVDPSWEINEFRINVLTAWEFYLEKKEIFRNIKQEYDW